MKIRQYLPILIAVVAALPGIVMRLAGIHADPPLAALVSGIAVLGASFLLLWACDVVQADISQTLALAIVALIAVLPEYAVDMYFTWEAGQNPDSAYAGYAVANMTGANRLLIGVAWAAVAALYWLRHRKVVHLSAVRRTELVFLGMATVYAFVVCLKGTLAWYDGLVFLGLYVWYMRIAGGRPCEECEVDGPAEILFRLSKGRRRLATTVMFLYAAGAILANAEPFCEGLIGTGKQLGINEFVLVQWLAPLASEAPEFTVALMFALRGQPGIALGSLLSSKLNQWTLLVGMIPGVFAVSHGSLDHPLPMGQFQMDEILLTAAQSLLGVILLASLRLSLGGAFLLFSLFAAQLLSPAIVAACPGGMLFGFRAEEMHPLFSLVYFTVAAALFIRRPRDIAQLRHGLRMDPEKHGA
jgi:cation:H+ antiporter